MFLYKNPLVVATQSRARQTLLRSAGLAFETVLSPFDEEAEKPRIQRLSIPEQAEHLAKQKAAAVSIDYPNALVLGADQMGEFEQEALFKPKTLAEAVGMLQKLSGHSHYQHTAVCLYLNQRCVWSWVETTVLSMRELSKEHIDWYVQQEKPLHACGGYCFEGLGKHLFHAVEGDFDSVLGLPVLRLLNVLQDQDYIRTAAA